VVEQSHQQKVNATDLRDNMNDNLENLEEAKIKERLGINKTKDEITKELLDSLRRHNTLFGDQGHCGSVNFEPYPDKYFIAQEFNDNKDDLRKSIEAALKQFGYNSIRADDFYFSEKIICKIAGLIQGTPFGVYQLTKSQNRNVYLELGLSIGLERSFILVKEKDAIPARIVRDIEYYPIDSYLDIRYRLGKLIEEFMTSIGSFNLKKNHIADSNNNVAIYHGDTEDIDITVTVAKHIKNMGFTPLILGEFQEKLANYLKSEANTEPKFIASREQIIEAVQTSKFGVYRIHKSASADNFVALGVSIALSKPFLPIQLVSESVPSDLSFLSPIRYAGFTNLESQLQTQDWLTAIID
jgi:hypothetical protein